MFCPQSLPDKKSLVSGRKVEEKNKKKNKSPKLRRKEDLESQSRFEAKAVSSVFLSKSSYVSTSSTHRRRSHSNCTVLYSVSETNKSFNLSLPADSLRGFCTHICGDKERKRAHCVV